MNQHRVKYSDYDTQDFIITLEILANAFLCRYIDKHLLQ